MKLTGIPVSPGIAIGEIFVYQPFQFEVEKQHITQGEEDINLVKLDKALKAADNELADLVESYGDDGQGKIFTAHREFLNDEEILELTREHITEQKKIAEWAVFSAFGEYIEMLAAVNDPVISGRKSDLEDVRSRVLRLIKGLPEQNLSVLPRPVIVVAHDLLPSDTAVLDRKNVLGIITEVGGDTSHTAIIANSQHLPAVLGIKGSTDILTNGQLVCLDAMNGEVHLHPDNEIIADMESKRAKFLAKTAAQKKYLNTNIELSDGSKVEIGLNIGGTDKLEAYQYVDFVGLFRTEFLYMDSTHLPTEEEQYAAYKRVLEHAKGKPVTLRTLDIGGDKTLPYMQLPDEENPFLGQRALRLCLARPELLKTQLRAALRASVYGILWIMFPMVGQIDDFKAARSIFEAVKAELLNEGIDVGTNLKLGVMIEIPSLAMVADQIAKEVDFASIGTNDLCQYLCAADRMNPETADYYQPFSPAMVRTLTNITEAFKNENKPISVCGEMAGDIKGAVLLVGLGMRKLSVSESKIAAVKSALSQIDIKKVQLIAESAKTAACQQDVINLVNSCFALERAVLR